MKSTKYLLKCILIGLPLLACGSAAFAGTYDCGMPKTRIGEVAMGGPAYQVDLYSDSIVLETVSYDTGKAISHSFPMKEVKQLKHAGIWEANGVAVVITVARVKGQIRPVMRLFVGSGKNMAVATCEREGAGKAESVVL